MTSEEQYDEYYEWAKQKLKGIETSKQETINELAEKLENSGMPLEMISAEISRNLEGYVSDRYVRDCLNEKYKVKRKQTSKPNEKEKEEILVGEDTQETRKSAEVVPQSSITKS